MANSVSNRSRQINVPPMVQSQIRHRFCAKNGLNRSICSSSSLLKFKIVPHYFVQFKDCLFLTKYSTPEYSVTRTITPMQISMEMGGIGRNIRRMQTIVTAVLIFPDIPAAITFPLPMAPAAGVP